MTPSPSVALRPVRARTGCRVDLAGGTLDIWPLGLLHSGASTLNVAIDLPVVVEVRPAERRSISVEGSVIELARWSEPPADSEIELLALVAAELQAPALALRVESAAPRGSGLGASSSIVVALIAALDHALGRPERGARATVELARDLEARMMGLPTGVQDHWPALFGGALVIEHRPGALEVHRLEVDLDALERHLIVVHSGESHVSARQNWAVIRRRLDGEAEVTARLQAIADAARQARAALERGDLEGLGEAMEREWHARRGLAPGLETPRLSELSTAAKVAGAWGVKVCGAGGGGCLAVLAPESERSAVIDALQASGATLVELGLRRGGLDLTALGGA